MAEQKILLIDDDATFLEDIQIFLKPDYRCTTAGTLSEGSKKFTQGSFDLVVLDIHFGGKKNGLDLLKELRSKDRVTPVIMVTREEDIDTVVSAMKYGANDYIRKPVTYKELLLRIRKVQKEARLIRENISLKEQLQQKQIPFFGKSPQIIKIKETIQRISALTTPVLITGETGVGKEIAAREIHRQSNRSDQPFYVINCSAIPENLIESELFGYTKGAYTGAIHSAAGKFKQAHGSTLLIDEIGDLSLAVQTKLLNVLETQQFYPLGSTELVQTDIRFLFATNANLSEKVKNKEFREDLFYRINVVQIEIPPLRERPQDIELLVDYYLNLFSQLHGKEDLTISEEAASYLKAQPWPGNIRQLKNVIERAVLFCRSGQIALQDVEMQKTLESAADFTHLDYNSAKQQALREFQKSYIQSYLERTGGNITEAARLMNLPRPSLQRMVKILEQVTS